MAASRRGKSWSAYGYGDLLKLNVRFYEDGFPNSPQLEANILSTSYHPSQLKVLNDPVALALPERLFTREQLPEFF